MTDATPLSPTAQAVRDAVLATYADNIPKDDNLWALDRASVVAALRAAADQVVPKMPKPSANSDYHLMNWTKSLDQHYQRQQTRDELLAIAAELEGSNG